MLGLNFRNYMRVLYARKSFELHVTNDVNSENDEGQSYKDDEFLQIKCDDVNMDPEIEKKIIQTLQENMPSELEVRMNLMGINSFTIAGYCLAAFIMVMNYILGYGWAADLLGISSN